MNYYPYSACSCRIPPVPDADLEPYADIPGPRRRSGTDQTTERLLEAASREFMERGYEAARVSSIARRAGLTPGAVPPFSCRGQPRILALGAR